MTSASRVPQSDLSSGVPLCTLSLPALAFLLPVIPSLFLKCIRTVHKAIVNLGVSDTSSLYSILIDTAVS